MAKSLRVLIVDNQPRARQSLKALLATWPGIESIREAATGKTALALIEEIIPDAVLMDMHMPEMSGLEATRRIKAKWTQVKIIVLSTDPENQAEALAAGADAFICRCEPPAELLATLEKLIK